MRLFEWALVAWLLILPLFFSNGQYEPVKVKIFFEGGIFLVFYWIRVLFRKNIMFSQVDKFYFLWLGWFLVAGYGNIGLASTLFGGEYRHQGVVFFFLLWLTGKFIEQLSPKAKSVFRRLLIWGGIIQALFVTVEYTFSFGWKLYSYKGPLGTLGEPNATAAYIVFSLLPLTDSRLSWRRILVIIGVVLPALWLLKSVTAWLLLAGAFVLSAIVRQQRKSFLYLPLIAPVILFLVIFLLPQPATVTESRYWIWRMSLLAISRNLIAGYGPDTNEAVLGKIYETSGRHLLGLSIDRSHNTFLDIALWSGIVGLGLFMAWLGKIYHSVIISAVKNVKTYRCLGLSAWLLFATVHPVGIIHWLYLMYFVHL